MSKSQLNLMWNNVKYYTYMYYVSIGTADDVVTALSIVPFVM